MTEWRTVAEQALLWRCARGAVHSAITRGDLPATMIAGRWLIDPADAEKYEAEKRNVARVTKRTRRPRKRAS
jgi:hypothetical protein